MQIGSIELLVECGDITKEATDAIVNITNESFNLKEGKESIGWFPVVCSGS